MRSLLYYSIVKGLMCLQDASPKFIKLVQPNKCQTKRKKWCFSFLPSKTKRFCNTVLIFLQGFVEHFSVKLKVKQDEVGLLSTISYLQAYISFCFLYLCIICYVHVCEEAVVIWENSKYCICQKRLRLSRRNMVLYYT